MCPMRSQMLEALAEPGSAASVARKLDVPRQKVQDHLRELEKQGLVELIEERRRGNCVERIVRATAKSYVVSAEALATLAADPDAARDVFSSRYLVAGPRGRSGSWRCCASARTRRGRSCRR